MRFDLEATGIGSLPFKEPKEACRVILDTFRAIPFWPQLTSWIEGSVRFMTMAKPRAFLT